MFFQGDAAFADQKPLRLLLAVEPPTVLEFAFLIGMAMQTLTRSLA